MSIGKECESSQSTRTCDLYPRYMQCFCSTILSGTSSVHYYYASFNKFKIAIRSDWFKPKHYMPLSLFVYIGSWHVKQTTHINNGQKSMPCSLSIFFIRALVILSTAFSKSIKVSMPCLVCCGYPSMMRLSDKICPVVARPRRNPDVCNLIVDL